MCNRSEGEFSSSFIWCDIQTEHMQTNRIKNVLFIMNETYDASSTCRLMNLSMWNVVTCMRIPSLSLPFSLTFVPFFVPFVFFVSAFVCVYAIESMHVVANVSVLFSTCKLFPTQEFLCIYRVFSAVFMPCVDCILATGAIRIVLFAQIFRAIFYMVCLHFICILNINEFKQPNFDGILSICLF